MPAPTRRVFVQLARTTEHVGVLTLYAVEERRGRERIRSLGRVSGGVGQWRALGPGMLSWPARTWRTREQAADFLASR